MRSTTSGHTRGKRDAFRNSGVYRFRGFYFLHSLPTLPMCEARMLTVSEDNLTKIAGQLVSELSTIPSSHDNWKCN
eukprot:1998905-Amphidinium_carterae.1